MLPVTLRFPTVPASVKVIRVFGDASASWKVSVPLFPAVARVMVGLRLVRLSAEEADAIIVSLAISFATPVTFPALVIPVPFMLSPPPSEVVPADTVSPPAVILKPPVEIVCAAAKVLLLLRYATLLNAVLVLISTPLYFKIGDEILPLTESAPTFDVSVSVNKLAVPSLTMKLDPEPSVIWNPLVTVAPPAAYVPPVSEPPETEPPESDPPESVALLIVPRPESVGVPEPVILPVNVYPPMLVAERVLTGRVPVVPFSFNVKSV